MKKLFIFSLSLLALVFTGCSSDTDELGGTRSMNEYTPEQIKQIQTLQEEYGVTFDFPTKSEKELPSMNEIEDVCKIAASLQACTKNLKMEGNTFKSTKKRTLKTRGFSQGQEFSGEHTRSANIGTYGHFDYEITVSNLTPTSGSASVRVINLIIEDLDYDISYYDCEKKFTGSRHLDYTFIFKVTNLIVNHTFEVRVSDSLNLESGRRN